MKAKELKTAAAAAKAAAMKAERSQMGPQMGLGARMKAHNKLEYNVEERVAPVDILCEECEKRSVAFFCSLCDQMLCARCEELCHQADFDGVKHSHIDEKAVRPVQYGDISRVYIPPIVFNLPEYELNEFEYSALSNVDITIPNSLANSKNSGMGLNSAVLPLSNSGPVSSSGQGGGPKIISNDAKNFRTIESKDFLLNEYVVFFDPINKRKSFGRILRLICRIFLFFYCIITFLLFTIFFLFFLFFSSFFFFFSLFQYIFRYFLIFFIVHLVLSVFIFIFIFIFFL